MLPEDVEAFANPTPVAYEVQTDTIQQEHPFVVAEKMELEKEMVA